MAADSSISAFLQACGLSGPLELEILAPDRTVRASKWGPFAIIGRGKRADLRLEHDAVSERHAFLQVIDGKVFGFDLASNTGTHWPDGPRPSDWLEPGEALRVGPYRIGFAQSSIHNPQSAIPRPLPLVPSPSSLVPLSVEFLNGKTHTRRWRIDRVLTLVGSAPACKLRLVGSRVAPFHCYLVATPTGVWVVDLASPGGLFRNGVPVRFAPFRDGDQLLIGEFLVRAREEKDEGIGTRDEGRGVREEPVSMLHDELSLDPRPSYHAPRPSSLNPRPSSLVPLSHSTDPGLLPIMNQFSLMQQQMFDHFQQTMLMMFQMFGTLQQKQMDALREELDRVHELTRELQTLQEKLEGQESEVRSQKSEVRSQESKVESRKSEEEPVTPDSGFRIPDKSEHSLPTADPANLHAWLYQRMESVRQERQSRWQSILNLLGSKH